MLCVPAFGLDASVPQAQRNAILFSWDGVQREHLMQCLSRNELPNLAALIKEGNLVNIDVAGHQTATKPGHVQMLTGYDPDVTGTFTNTRFKAIPEGLSIFERLEKTFGDDNITTIMLTGALHHIGACPGEPFQHVSKNVDVWDGESRRESAVNGPIMLDALGKYGKGRFFMFCHFLDPDHAGHAHGENSKEYNDGIIACDRWLGKAVNKLKELGVYDKAMVFVTSDHGFDEGTKGHSNASRVTLATNLKALTKNGDQRDITPTILTEMGVDISKSEPKYKGVVLTAQ